MTDLKTSILVNRQVPEFIRDEHPKFVTFLEAYYEFLENSGGLIEKSKDLRYLSDVDYSLEQFERGFYSTFLSLLPQGINLDKATLIKNILPIYLSKGSEKSFELLFKLLFGEDVQVKYPKNQILMASSGKWEQNNILRVDSGVTTSYVGDGVTTEFKLAQQTTSNDIDVYVNDELVTSGFFVLKEYRKIIFNSPLVDGSTLKISYKNFDYLTLTNRKIFGATSKATALIEKVIVKQFTETPYLEVYIDTKTLLGNFINGEVINCDIIVDGILVDTTIKLLSDLSKITILNGGASYNVGDPVIVRGPAQRPATAIVDVVASGLIEDVRIFKTGAGFQINAPVEASGYSNVFFEGVVQTIDSQGITSANTLTLNSDTIDSYANIVLSAVDYGFPTSGTDNVNTTISDALSSLTLTNLGEVTSIGVLTSLLSNSEAGSYEFNVISPVVNNNTRLVSLGIIGKIDIISGGLGYAVDDVLNFVYDDTTFGRGASAKVKTVGVDGDITSLEIIDGGLNHSSQKFPTITVTSSGGVGANLVVNCIMGDGEYVEGIIGQYLAGQILSIKIIDAGTGYLNVPAIDLSRYGNGEATALAEIRDSYQKLPGKWGGETGLLSTENTKLEGRDYFINYSYVLSSKVEFNRYKDIFKQFIHPAGTIVYGEYSTTSDVTTNRETSVVKDSVVKGLAGTVNVNSSIYVIGTDTYFIVAQNNNLISTGTEIYINNEKRTIDSIVSNTEFTVTDAFTTTANGQDIIIVS